MNFWVYILISQSSGRFYIGQTADLDKRLARHNANRVPSTKSRGPWTYLYTKPFHSRSEAIAQERKLKNLKSKKRVLKWIYDNLDNKGQAGPEFYQILDLD